MKLTYAQWGFRAWSFACGSLAGPRALAPYNTAAAQLTAAGLKDISSSNRQPAGQIAAAGGVAGHIAVAGEVAGQISSG